MRCLILECGKVFTSQPFLVKHINTKHAKEVDAVKEHQCFLNAFLSDPFRPAFPQTHSSTPRVSPRQQGDSRDYPAALDWSNFDSNESSPTLTFHRDSLEYQGDSSQSVFRPIDNKFDKRETRIQLRDNREPLARNQSAKSRNEVDRRDNYNSHDVRAPFTQDVNDYQNLSGDQVVLESRKRRFCADESSSHQRPSPLSSHSMRPSAHLNNDSVRNTSRSLPYRNSDSRIFG